LIFTHLATVSTKSVSFQITHQSFIANHHHNSIYQTNNTMSAFQNFDRLAMSEAQFLRMAEAEYQQHSRPNYQQSTPTFVQRFLFKSPSLGTNSIKGGSPSASPSLSASPANSPRMTMDAFGSSPQMGSGSPSMGAGWGLGLVFRKRSNTNSSFGSDRSPRMGGTSPSLGAASPRMGGAGIQGHKRNGSGGSGESELGNKDEFGLTKNRWVSQLF
jgi:hypothetical protein